MNEKSMTTPESGTASETPRTNAMSLHVEGRDIATGMLIPAVHADFARTLERELSQRTASLDKAEDELAAARAELAKRYKCDPACTDGKCVRPGVGPCDRPATHAADLAHLIAAAPDLYEIVNAFVYLSEHPWNNPNDPSPLAKDCPLIIEARAALCKARGDLPARASGEEG